MSVNGFYVKSLVVIAKILISLSKESIIEEINKTLLFHIGSVTVNHPDVLYFKAGEKLGIEQARKIKEHFSLKPYSARGRVVVMEAATLTVEAQNALLKTLEELPKEGSFILGVKTKSDLLPTIISRCQIKILEPGGKGDYHTKYDEDISKLLQSTLEDRFEYIEKLKEREEFLHSLVQYFRTQLAFHPKGAGSNLRFLKELLQAEEWANQNVNIRAILEYLMLAMPGNK